MRVFLTIFFSIAVLFTACKDEESNNGDKFFKKGEYQKAVAAYTEYLRLEPTHIKSLYNRGRAYEELGEPEKALQDFKKVIKEDPLNVNAHLSITNDFYHRLNDYENTIFYADKTLKLNEKNAVAHTLKGKAFQKLGKLQEAMAAYNAALSVNDEYADAYVSRGLLKIHMGQKSRACSDLKMAKSLGAGNAEDIIKKYCK